MPDRIVPARTYVAVCAALLILTAITVGLAHVDLRGLNSVVGLAIAALKAALIAWFFMHLRSSWSMTRVVGVAALLWLGILIVGTLDDILTRGWLAVPGK
jgi:cytochrome c oxidase subunit IV